MTGATRKQTNRRNVMIAVLTATFLSAIEGTIVSTAMPKIVSDLGGVESMSWVVSIYLLTTVISTPIYGKSADLFGRKKVFTFGSLLFLLGSALSGMSQSMNQLIVFRAIQGLGAGALMPVTSTIIGDIFPLEQRAKMQGLLSVIWGIAGVLGPLTGGMIVDLVSWHWIFYFNLPFGFIALVILWTSLHEDFEKRKHSIDYGGIMTFTLSMVLLLYAFLQGGSTYPWGSPVMIGLFASSALLFIAFIWIERRVPEPMLPLHLFKIRIISLANASGFLISAILVAVNFYVPLWIQGVYGKGATYSGLMLIPMTLLWTAGSMNVGRVIGKWGARPIILAGMVMITAGSIGLSTIGLSSPPWMIALFAAACGLGFGSVFTSHTVSIQSAVGWEQRGIAIASNSFLRILGQVIGIAVFGAYMNSRLASWLEERGIDFKGNDLNEALNTANTELPEHLLQPFREALAFSLNHVFIVLGILAVISLAISFALPRIRRENEKAES